MPYDADETSVHDGEPVELYQFTDSVSEYLYTSYHDTVVHNTKTYVPVPISRSEAKGGPQGEDTELRIEMPYDLDIVNDYAFSIAPTSLVLTIHRLHAPSGDSIVYWKGKVGAVSVQGRKATVIVPSTFGGALESSVPSVYYQEQCNHVLYDSRCALSRSAFKTDATVSTILDEITIDVSTVGGAGVDVFRAGELVVVSTGERRLILRQSGTILTINFPFRSVSVSDAVELYKGCDHLIVTCRDKFSNVVNFGGHSLIPLRNIFETGIT